MTTSSPGKPKLGGKQRVLLQIERFSRNHYKLVFLLAGLAVAGAIFLGSKIRYQSDVLGLFPKDNKYVSTFKSALEDFGSVDFLLVLLEAGEDEGPDELEEFADAFAERLESMPEMVELVEYRFRPDADFLEVFYENALLFLAPEKLPDIEQKLSDESIRRQVEENRLSLASPAAGLMEDLLATDPLGLMPLFFDRLVGNRGAMKLDLSDGYYLSRDGRSLIMLVKPTGHAQDLEFNQALLDGVRGAENDVRAQLNELRVEYDEAPLEVVTSFSGNYAIALDETGLIKQDLRRNLFVSLFAVSVLYWLCYRRFAALLYSTLPLLIGQALTFGVAFFALGFLATGRLEPGQLNASSAAFTALLMGLGTDFTIVMYARYVEERQNGKNLVRATELMVGETGLGVFTGAITSAGTFYAMCISRFRGLFDLGFLIGSGILLCAVAIVLLLPAMITWNESVRPRTVDPVKKLHLQSFGLEHLISFSVRYRWFVIAGITLLTVGAGLLALRLDFDDSVRSLRSGRSEAFGTQEKIGETFGVSLSYMMAIAEAPTHEEAVELSGKIEQRLAPFLESGVITSYDSVLTYLPREEQQSRIIEVVREGADGPYDRQRIRATFLDALDENGFRRDAYDDYLDRMERFLSPLVDLQKRGLGRIIDRYVHEDDDGVRIVTYLFSSDRRWKRRPPPGLIEALSGDDEGIIVTGTNVVGRELREIFLKDAPQGVAVGLVIVFVLLLVDFRDLRLTSIALAQLITGVIMMLGLMKIVGLIFPDSAVGTLNYANAFVATMILGVGIDYSIHLVHRMKWTEGRVEPGLLETGKAVVLAALTNIAGFGTLTLGNYPALRSFGTVALFGSLTCLFTSLTLVPALMARKNADK